MYQAFCHILPSTEAIRSSHKGHRNPCILLTSCFVPLLEKELATFLRQDGEVHSDHHRVQLLYPKPYLVHQRPYFWLPERKRRSCHILGLKVQVWRSYQIYQFEPSGKSKLCNLSIFSQGYQLCSDTINTIHR